MLGMLEGCTCIPAGERADGEDGGCLSPGPGVAPTSLDPDRLQQNLEAEKNAEGGSGGPDSFSF